MKNPKCWSKIKSRISSYSPDEFLEIIKDLYDLSGQNKTFLESRLLRASLDSLKPYKKIIEKALYPSITSNRGISLKDGKKAISDYKKSTKDDFGTMELMLFYIECGHKFTCEYGDIDEPFYNSLISVFGNLAELVKKHPDYKNVFYDRMKKIADESCKIGWGYDEIHSIFKEYTQHRVV